MLAPSGWFIRLGNDTGHLVMPGKFFKNGNGEIRRAHEYSTVIHGIDFNTNIAFKLHARQIKDRQQHWTVAIIRLLLKGGGIKIKLY